jgi:N-acetylmuramoyl-L-alanine amidase
MTRIVRLVLVCLLALPLSGLTAEKGLTVTGVRHFSYAAFTRIVFEIEGAAPYVLTKTAGGQGILLMSYEGPLILKAPVPAVSDGIVNGIEAKEETGRKEILIRLNAAGEVKDFVLHKPDRIVVDVIKTASSPVPPASDKSLVVVLDPGHGGLDTGITTPQGPEKSITLELAKTVKKMLQTDPRLKVVLTRDADSQPSLDERAAAANSAGADVFVSIHAAQGLTGTVYIQDPYQDPGAQATPPGRDFLSFEAGSELRDKHWGRQQAAHAMDSGALGRTLARQVTGEADAEPAQAPVAGLKTVDAAAVLIEIGTEQNRTKAAEAIVKGIEQHVGENR